MSAIRYIIICIVLIGVLVGHWVYTTVSRPDESCGDSCFTACVPEPADSGGFIEYFRENDYMVGLAYALAGAFTIFSLFTMRDSRKQGAGAAAGGSLLLAGLYASVCFLTGCCGSPMLAVYLGLFGSSALGLGKPLILGVTVLSVTGGWLWLRRKRCCSDQCT